MSQEHDQIRALYRAATGGRDACPDSTALARLVAGERWFFGRRRAVAHLAECRACADDMHALLAARPGLQDALHGLVPASAANGIGVLLRPALAVAGIAAAFGLALTLDAPPDPRSVSPMVGESTPERPLFASDFDDRPTDTLFRDNFDNG